MPMRDRCGVVLGFVSHVRQHRQVTPLGRISLPQRFSLYADLSVNENIAVLAEIHGMRDYAARRDRLLELTQLASSAGALAGPAVGRS